MAGIVVVFDFDKTILDCDSDDWVVDKFGLNEAFDRLRPTLPWNSLMDRMMMELHSRGKTAKEIADCLKEAPLHPKIVSAIKSARASGCDLRILSDSNVFFIETILQHHSIMGCFAEINTNPGSVDAKGRLNISPYQEFHHPSHGCKICPPNMCKGVVMDKIRSSASSAGGKKRFVYVGDGKADLCAGMKLEEEDVLLPRKGFPVWDLICRNPTLIKATVREWTDAGELETVLLNSVDALGCPENGNAKAIHSIPTTCKFQTSLLDAAPESHAVRREPEPCSSVV